MVNRRLRGAMLNAEITAARLAQLAEVDVKTVQRWLTEDRMPYPITRHRVARALGHEETYLWPALLADGLGGETEGVGGIWPTRTAISSETWHSLFGQAKRQIDILIYAGAFLIETLDLADVLRFKAGQGAAIRVLVGDPDSAALNARAEELELAWLPERCRTTATYLVRDVGAAAHVRSHGTTLYASQFRFDDTLLINTHVHGVWAAQSPVFRLECNESPVFQFYANTFDRVWALAGPVLRSDSGHRS
ncbi:transcriptional regulator [Microlunatus endophyticus]|uniref:Transcriptional regulator n=1 Tax=Microlunatus endophyticus TaxID=1716077 RepID=A0A917SDT3_9ACTN|nr:helix-turn-helix transcriptional regulator [Microlunatus endophyticus]GGL70599.1 transcriptional regulator [Microlunatus endophyticus]